MLNDLKNLALIPARGGSKRLPGKNIRVLGGRPLVSHTIEAAINCKCFDKIVLSTDSKEIVEVGTRYNEVVIDRRPQELATDSATVCEVALELLERYEKANKGYGLITILLPTCPFRNLSDIVKGFDCLSSDVDSVISVSQYDFPPQKGLILDSNELLHPVWPNSPLFRGKTRSQDQFPVYHENACS